MIIAEINGGFASQLQKYALGYGLAKAKNTELCLDLSNYMKGYFRPFVLNAFNLPDCKLLNKNEILLKSEIIDTGEELLHSYENWNSQTNYYIHGEESNYDLFLEKYPEFRMNSLNIVYQYVSLKCKSEFVDSFIAKNIGCNSIGVHIRLGDFTTLGISESLDYYKACIGYLLKRKPDSQVYFFSNDIISVKNEFGSNANFTFVDRKNGYLGDLEEFICLSSCKEKVITVGSTYSRYATQLGMQSYGSDKAIASRYLSQMEESTYLLSDSDRRDGLDFFISKLQKHNGDNDAEAQTMSEIRYDTMVMNGDLFRDGLKVDFWKKYYSDINCSEKAIIVIDEKKYNKWFRDDMFVRAMTYARMGERVIYFGRGDSNATETIFRAKDMDGKDLGFDMILLDKRIISNRIVDRFIKTELKENPAHFTKKRKRWIDSIITFSKVLLRRMISPGTENLAEYNRFLPDKLSDLNEISSVSELYETIINEKN